jgi:hypothetical protein
MAEPTRKSHEIEIFLNGVLGTSRVASIKSDICVLCKQPAIWFRDRLSEREYRISGMCQRCQDSTFGK